MIGNGAWGSALAAHFARVGHNVGVWGRSQKTLPDGCKTADNFEGADAVVLSTPAQTTRQVLANLPSALPAHVPVIITAKGFEQTTLALQSDIVQSALPDCQPYILTGPSFAADVSIGKPTALTLAGADLGKTQTLRDALSGGGVRLYSTDDMIGAQIGGAMKNVIAIACGLAVGMGLGASAQAALMTRGFAEMVRLGLAMGARAQTMSGLSGLGDLTLTCHSTLSRNFTYGHALGELGAPPKSGTFEGAKSASAALALGQKHGVDLPICAAVAQVVDAPDARDRILQTLMDRPLRDEA
ncbi:MAG: NAD(P)H-dependent glycerol-3-phosphate dehydrogenase [Planktomarina sp.]